MIDQLIIGNSSSYDDFEASVKERTLNAPKKKSIKETVPFSNVTYDFSAINGEIYWEERELEYVFEITADNPEELEEKKQNFSNWIMNVTEEEIHDPFVPEYHFIGTFDDISFDDSEIEKSTISVIFKAYPYKISNTKKTFTLEVAQGVRSYGFVTNNSSHRITPTFEWDSNGYGFAFAITDNEGNYTTSHAFPDGVTTPEIIKFEPGLNRIVAITTGPPRTLKISFHEEVF